MPGLFFHLFVCFFEIGFLCVVLAFLELALKTKLKVVKRCVQAQLLRGTVRISIYNFVSFRFFCIM